MKTHVSVGEPMMCRGWPKMVYSSHAGQEVRTLIIQSVLTVVIFDSSKALKTLDRVSVNLICTIVS